MSDHYQDYDAVGDHVAADGSPREFGSGGSAIDDAAHGQEGVIRLPSALQHGDGELRSCGQGTITVTSVEAI